MSEAASSMRSRISTPLWLVAAVIPIAFAAAQSAAEEPFHAARSPPEKALVEILLLSDRDDNLFDFVLKRPGYDAKKDKGYARLFTKGPLAAWAGAEARAVESDCQGKYIEGEICGIDYSPITCGNAISDTGYRFRTVKADEREAILSTRWAGQEAEADGRNIDW
jgi:hypothetical protein